MKRSASGQSMASMPKPGLCLKGTGALRALRIRLLDQLQYIVTAKGDLSVVCGFSALGSCIAQGDKKGNQYSVGIKLPWALDAFT